MTPVGDTGALGARSQKQSSSPTSHICQPQAQMRFIGVFVFLCEIPSQGAITCLFCPICAPLTELTTLDSSSHPPPLG